MHATLSPQASPKARRKPSTRRPSHLPPVQTQESHDAALHAIRSFLKGHTSYDAFPISFRLIVLDTKLNVKKALQCLLLNGGGTNFPAELPRLNLTLYPFRRGLSPAVEQRAIPLCGYAHGSRYHSPHPILLPYCIV